MIASPQLATRRAGMGAREHYAEVRGDESLYPTGGLIVIPNRAPRSKGGRTQVAVGMDGKTQRVKVLTSETRLLCPGDVILRHPADKGAHDVERVVDLLYLRNPDMGVRRQITMPHPDNVARRELFTDLALQAIEGQDWLVYLSTRCLIVVDYDGNAVWWHHPSARRLFYPYGVWATSPPVVKDLDRQLVGRVAIIAAALAYRREPSLAYAMESAHAAAGFVRFGIAALTKMYYGRKAVDRVCLHVMDKVDPWATRLHEGAKDPVLGRQIRDPVLREKCKTAKAPRTSLEGFVDMYLMLARHDIRTAKARHRLYASKPMD